MSAPSDVPGVTPPSLVLTSTDKGGLVVVMTALAMCFVLVAFLIRMYVRMSVSGYQLDDFVLTLATVKSWDYQSAIRSKLTFKPDYILCPILGRDPSSPQRIRKKYGAHRAISDFTDAKGKEAKVKRIAMQCNASLENSFNLTNK